MLSRRLLRVKVAKNLYAHLKSGAENLRASEKNLVESIDRAYDLYFQMLSLIVEVAHYAEGRQELAKLETPPWRVLEGQRVSLLPGIICA